MCSLRQHEAQFSMKDVHTQLWPMASIMFIFETGMLDVLLHKVLDYANELVLWVIALIYQDNMVGNKRLVSVPSKKAVFHFTVG